MILTRCTFQTIRAVAACMMSLEHYCAQLLPVLPKMPRSGGCKGFFELDPEFCLTPLLCKGILEIVFSNGDWRKHQACAPAEADACSMAFHIKQRCATPLMQSSSNLWEALPYTFCRAGREQRHFMHWRKAYDNCRVSDSPAERSCR